MIVAYTLIMSGLLIKTHMWLLVQIYGDIFMYTYIPWIYIAL